MLLKLRMENGAFMKKIFALIMVGIMSVSMAACDKIGGSSKEITPNLDNQFSCDMALEYGDMNCDAILKRYGVGTWEAEFISPDTLAGITMSFDGDNVTANYKGLDFSIPKSALPVKSILCNLIDIIDETASQEKIEAEDKKDYLVIEGKAEQGDYTIQLDKNTGNLVSFEMPGLDLKINFSNVTLGQTQTTTTGDGSMTAPEVSGEETTGSAAEQAETLPEESIAETEITESAIATDSLQ